tara:strand:+ start:275 stop:1081 length:807 start_codon:yes stop_codon:yes gene_type:complete
MHKKQIQLEKLLDLLVLEASEKLSQQDREELNRLLDIFPEYTSDYFHKTTALAQVGFYLEDDFNNEALPQHIRKKTLYRLKKELGQSSISDHLNNFMRTLFYKPQYAWALTIVMAIGLSFSMIQFKNYESNFRYLPLKKIVMETTAKDLIQYPWHSRTNDLGPINGDIIWSDQGQKGFIQIAGLPMNDPNKNQYQIWIIDPLKYEQAVDGGIFDVTRTDKAIIIPINPKLPISKAVGFAITLEQPGGVVVSSEPLLLTAPKERPEVSI